MKTSLVMNFSVDKENNRVNVEREFAAPVGKVWAAWTQQELLDQWWAPRPWKARTKSMDFREGGTWLYAMVGPRGRRALVEGRLPQDRCEEELLGDRRILRCRGKSEPGFRPLYLDEYVHRSRRHDDRFRGNSI